MAIGINVMNAPVNTNWSAPRPATTDTTPANLGDRFTPSNGNETGIYSFKDVRAAVTAKASTETDANASPEQKRALFLHGMKEAGIKPSNPPTPEELKRYFGTFNTPEKREQALDALRNYSDGFHVHTAQTPDGDQDVQYSKDKLQFGYNRKVYNNLKDANAAPEGKPGEKIQDIQTYDASSWKDVQSRPTSDGRKVQDCEGFAFMQKELLQAAGYETQMVATQGDEGYAHAMVLARNPDTGTYVVGSNADVLVNSDPDAALQNGWNRATSFKQQGHGDWYYGKTQSEAQARMTARAR